MVYTTGGSKTTKNVNTSHEERNSFVLQDGEILSLSRWAVIIEDHYGKPMDMEWAKDGETGKLFIVQARPETVQSRRDISLFKSYTLKEKGKRLLSGLAIGEAIVSGKAMVLKDTEEEDRFEEGAILVTGTTDPDWVSIMKKASGIITDHGGRTSHAAIVSRELAVPAIVGTENATRMLSDGQEITLSCAEGEEGFVYEGSLDFEEKEIDLGDIPESNTQMMINLASPAAAFRWWPLPADGIGLARMEFIINNIIKVHPMALVRFEELEDEKVKREIEKLTHGYEDKSEYFISNLARGVARIAASQYPNEVIVRMSDFKTNEYADLVGGARFEFEENNPMLGFRGASRYYSERYREGFGLECQAMKRAREEMGLDNIVLMIPFCRTLEEADRVLETMREYGLERGENGLRIYVMCEIPSNVVLADQFAQRFDGFSIGSNDLTQLVLGIDRDSEELSALFDERNEAVKRMISELIPKAHEQGRKVGICGQGPSDHPDFAAFLVKEGIDSISLNPDSFLEVKKHVAEVEKKS
jgi:pyruvate,water dikinase